MAALEALRKLGTALGGRVDLHETLGEGGMGIVHLGTQSTLGRSVAVKTLRKDARTDDAILRITGPGVGPDDVSRVARYVREQRAHPVSTRSPETWESLIPGRT